MNNMMMKPSNGAAASLAYQGGTSGPGGKRNGQPTPSGPLSYDDAHHRADGKAMGKDNKLRGTIRIGAWNVRTLLQPASVELLTREMDRCKVQLMGISEMRWAGKGHFTTPDGHTIYFSGNQKGGQKGVAFIADQLIAKRVLGYNPINDRLMTIRLQAKPINFTVIQVYAPTSTANDDDVDEFYAQLQDTLDKASKRDVVMIIGDFNAKIGAGYQHEEEKVAIGKHGLGVRNKRGDSLVDFCIGNELVVANTLFQQHPRRLYTWISPNGKVRNQIDFILIKKRWKSSVKVAKTLPGADVGSDHQLLIANIRVKLKKVETCLRAKRFDLGCIDDHYRVATKNRFSELLSSDAEKTPDELWLDLKASILDSAKKHIPTQRRKKSTPWLSQEVIALSDERRQLKEAGLKNSRLYRLISSEIQLKARRDKNNHIKMKCQELEDHSQNQNSRSLFRAVKDLTSKSTAKLAVIKDEDGKILTESEEIKDRWKRYCEELYASQELNEKDDDDDDGDDDGDDDDDDESSEEEPDILLSEVVNAIHHLKNNKSPGPDEVPAELIKHADELGAVVIQRLCNKIWKTKTWPVEWKNSAFLTLPKKGDVSECKNNRTIALISHLSKILLHILNERLRPILDRELPAEQAGFRRGRGTRDQIANIRHILEKTREFNRKIYLCFIDYAKAFDCVRHGRLWTAMREMGVPDHLIKLITNLYDSQQACVRTAKGDSDLFNIGQGVRQGCILSPALFNLYAEYIMRRALADWDRGLPVGGRRISNLRYADDTTLVATNASDLKDLLLKVKAESEVLGLKLNVSKTKIMIVGGDGVEEPLLVDGTEVEQVTQFNFLGSLITTSGGCAVEIRRRLAMAKSAMVGLNKIWADRGITKATKTRLVSALIFPIATYGCETWSLTKSDQRRINSFELWCWRRMLRITWIMKRTNESVIQEVQPKKRLLSLIQSQMLSYFGHIARRDGDCLEKVIMQGRVEGNRKPGRPRARWIDQIKSVARSRSLQELYSLTKDRLRWRTIVDVTSCQS